MNIFFLTLAYPLDPNDKNIYSDLMDEIASRGNYVVVFKPDEEGNEAEKTWRGAVQIEIVPTGKVTKSSYAKKAINTLLLESHYRRALRIIGESIIPDLLIYSTPPITFLGAVLYAKRVFKCKTYLLLKDIFPANACDMGLIRYGGFAWRFSRHKEERLYNVSDRIGCMSRVNMEYILRNNRKLESSKVEICPNSIMPTPDERIPKTDLSLLEKYGIPQNCFKLIYGGNLGKPQCISFIIEVLEATREDNTLFFIIVGDGTDFSILENYIRQRKGKNVILLRKLSKLRYLSLLACMDVGLLFLDGKFTIPNYPSRILEYFDFSLPVVAATDVVTDIRDLLKDNACGFWSKSGDVAAMIRNIHALRDDPTMCREMGRRGRNVLVEQFTSKISADIILALHE